MIVIEKGIPVPGPEGRPKTYPWADMEVGDSFFVECPQVEARRLRATLYSCKRNYERRTPPKKFTCRQCRKGIRVWRIA